MTTLTVQEAGSDLGGWLRRAASGEQIAIHEGAQWVLLQPLANSPESSVPEQLTAREALRRLQAVPRLSVAEAESYLREVRTERTTVGERPDA